MPCMPGAAGNNDYKPTSQVDLEYEVLVDVFYENEFRPMASFCFMSERQAQSKLNDPLPGGGAGNNAEAG